MQAEEFPTVIDEPEDEEEPPLTAARLDELLKQDNIEPEVSEKMKKLYTQYEHRNPPFVYSELFMLASFISDDKFAALEDLIDVKGLNKQFDGFLLFDISMLDFKDIEKLKLFVSKNPGFIEKLSNEQIIKTVGMTDESVELFNSLENIEGRDLAPSLSVDERIDISKITHPDLKKYIKSHPNFMLEYYNQRTGILSLFSEPKTECFSNKDGNFETSLVNFAGQRKINHVYNYLNNIEQITTSIPDPVYKDSYVMFSEEIKRYDDDANLISTEKLIRGKNFGVINSSMTLNDGTAIPSQFYSVDPESGNTTISKDFTSPDGTKTDYYYEEADGMRILNYKITDKDGNVLMNREQTFHQTGKNDFVSSLNGNSYKVHFDDSKIVVEDVNNKKTVNIPLDKVAERNRDYVLAILKQMPGNQLMAMSELPINKITVADENSLEENSYWANAIKEINIGNHTVTNEDFLDVITSTFAHEYGHFLDSHVDADLDDVIAGNPVLDSIYKQELKNFQENTTTYQQDYISYFTDFERAYSERVAETNMLINTKANSITALRSMYFQKYFPKTIAKISELIDLREQGKL